MELIRLAGYARRVTSSWLIMGSSNISDAGLGIKQSPRYELNVAMKDYDDVKFCSDFDRMFLKYLIKKCRSRLLYKKNQ